MLIKALIKRHLTVYVRDRWAIFFSFLSVIIILALFMLFLKNSFSTDFQTIPGSEFVIHAWIISGVLMVSTVTVPLGMLGIMISDLEQKTINDFYVAPISRRIIVLSYLLSAAVIGLIFSIINLMLGQLYLFISFGEHLNVLSFMTVLGLLVLSNLLFSSLFFYAVSFLKTMNAHGTLSTLIGTLIGFLAGLYVPIGVLGGSTRTLLSLLPTMQMASALRIVYMAGALNAAQWPNQAYREGYESFIGVHLELFSTTLAPWMTLVIIVGWIVLFTGLSMHRLNHFKKQ